MTSTNQITVRITASDGTVRESRLDRDNVILGSGPGAAIQLADPAISGMHLMLKREHDGSVKAIDLGSEHGTLIGNQVVRVPTAIRAGDVIALGKYRVQVVFGGLEKQQAAPALATQAIAAKAVAATQARSEAASNGRPVHLNGSAAPVLQFQAPVLKKPEAPAAIAPPAPQVRAPARASRARTQFPFVDSHAAMTTGQRVLQVALAWGDQLLGVQHYADGYAVTIGEGRKNEFHVFSAGVGESFTLATAKKGKVTVHVPAGARAELIGANARRSAAQTNVLELGPSDAAQLEIENVAFLIRQVVAPAHVPVKGSRDLDWGFVKVVTICLMAGLALFASIHFTPKTDQDVLDQIEDKQQAQMVKLLVKPAPPPPQVKRAKQPDQKSGAEEGAKAEGEEGKFGKKEAVKEEADPSKAGSLTVDPNKKEKDRKKVQTTGLLAAFGKGSSEASSDVLGPGGVGTGLNEAFGGRKGGAGFGDAKGVGGLGVRGTGTGGGGTGLGIGGLGTKGDGRGAGGSGLDLGGKGHQTVKVIPGDTKVVGGLSKEVIAKIIRSHQNEIKYCYEQELNKTPDLAGKVAVAWQIGPDGSVSTANVTESTLTSSAVGQCMISRIKRWKFPEVPGGGVVDVSYPWVFKPAGAGAP